MKNKHKAVLNWLANYPELQSFLYFNTVKEELEFTSVNTITNETIEKEFYGSVIKNYDFALVMMKSYDTGTSDINVDELFNVEQFMLWIKEQNKEKKFPYFESADILEIKNLQNEPTFSGISQAGDVAKYMVQIRIRYLEKKEES